MARAPLGPALWRIREAGPAQTATLILLSMPGAFYLHPGMFFCSPWHWSILKSTAVDKDFELEVKARAESHRRPLRGGRAGDFLPFDSAEGPAASWFGKQSCSPHCSSQPAKEGEGEQTGRWHEKINNTEASWSPANRSPRAPSDIEMGSANIFST